MSITQQLKLLRDIHTLYISQDIRPASLITLPLILPPQKADLARHDSNREAHKREVQDRSELVSRRSTLRVDPRAQYASDVGADESHCDGCGSSRSAKQLAYDISANASLL